MVLFRELQSFSVPDFFSAAHTSKKLYSSFFKQPAHIHLFPFNVSSLDPGLEKGVSMGAWGRGRQRKKKKEKETTVAFQNLFSWGKPSFYPPALLPLRRAWELSVSLC